MQKTVYEITGRSFLPEFTTTVAYQSEQVFPLKDLHQMLMKEQECFQKEEAFYFLIEQLLENYTEKKPGWTIYISGKNKEFLKTL